MCVDLAPELTSAEDVARRERAAALRTAAAERSKARADRKAAVRNTLWTLLRLQVLSLLGRWLTSRGRDVDLAWLQALGFATVLAATILTVRWLIQEAEAQMSSL